MGCLVTSIVSNDNGDIIESNKLNIRPILFKYTLYNIVTVQDHITLGYTLVLILVKRKTATHSLSSYANNIK